MSGLKKVFQMILFIDQKGAIVKQRTLSGIFAAVMVFAIVSAICPGETNEKKLIQFGWDIRGASEIAEKIDGYQKAPFDGITVTSQVSYTFYSKNITEKAIAKEAEILKQINWGKFTDNFYMLYAADNVDWFDDKLWTDDNYILRNVGWCARLAKAGGFKGLLFDAEFVYAGQPQNPWKYEWQKRHKEKTFAEFEAIVRKRGGQVMDRIEKEFPNPVFFSLFWGSYSEFIKAGKEFDPINRENILNKQYYGLLNAFMVGMLEAADPGTTIIDGNEGSYYNVSPLQFYESYHNIHQASLELIPPELHNKYRAQVRCGQAVYADTLCNTREMHNMSTYLTPQERAKHAESSVYWAMKTSDRYVWWYNEKLSLLRNWNVDPEIAPAIESAKKKIAGNKPLGFDIMAIRTKGINAYRQAESRPIEPKTAKISRLAGRAPKIDGEFDDPVWENAAKLGPFPNHLTARVKKLETTTTSQMTYDDKNLYITFYCGEPEMETLHSAKFIDEPMAWPGDVVELAIAVDDAASAYYHIKVNTRNQRWDTKTGAGVEVYGQDSDWTGNYTTAVQKGKDHWSVEMAIPWASLNRKAPKPGDKIKGNLMRRTKRRVGPWECEYITWSQSRRSRYVEAENFGTWTF